MSKTNLKEIESKYRELLEEGKNPTTAIQMLSNYFTLQSICTWILRKSQNQPRSTQRKRS